jgi:uncharacterized membrane protein YfcA
MNNDREALSLRADCLGVIASAVCFVHCILTPVVLSLSAVSVHYLPSEEKVHRLLAVLIAGIGAFAIISGYRKHRRSRVLLLMSGGLSLIFAGAYLGDRLPSHLAEAAATLIGSCLLITAHIMNHTFCNNCDRCDENSG